MTKIKTYYYHYDGMFESDESLGDGLYVRLEDFEQLQKENETLKTCLFQMQNCAMELTKENEELKSYIEHILIPTNKETTVIIKEPINEHHKINLDASFKENELLKRKLDIVLYALKQIVPDHYTSELIRQTDREAFIESAELDIKIKETALKEIEAML